MKAIKKSIRQKKNRTKAAAKSAVKAAPDRRVARVEKGTPLVCDCGACDLSFCDCSDMEGTTVTPVRDTE